MPAGHGLRSRTRDSFSWAFRKKGPTHLTTYLRIFKIGDYVDVKVGKRIIRKMIHVRVDHVQPLRCHEEIQERIKKNDKLKAEAKAQGKIISAKRQPEEPKPSFMMECATLETVTPPFHVVNDLKGGY